MDEIGIDINIIESYVEAIDNKDIDKIKKLNHKINILDLDINNVVSEIYNKHLLTSERLRFIIENQNSTLKITPTFIKRLLNSKNYEFSLLDIIFEYILNIFDFDNESILKLLLHYKNGIPISTSALERLLKQYNFTINGDSILIGYYTVDYQTNWVSEKWLHLPQYMYKACSIKFTFCKIFCQ